MFDSPLGWLIIASIVLSGGGYIISKLYGLSMQMTKRKKTMVSSIIYFLGYITFFICFALYMSKNTETSFLVEYTALLRRNTVWFIIPSIFKGEMNQYVLLLLGGTVPLLLTSAIGAFLAINVLEIEDTRRYGIWREDLVDTENDEVLETSYSAYVKSGESEGQQIMNMIYVVIFGNLFLPVITMGIIGVFYTSKVFNGIKKYLFILLIVSIVGVTYFIR